MEKIKSCRICQNPNIVDFLDLGEQPFANSLLKGPDEEEAFYPLTLSWCPDCRLVQLNHTAEPADLFSSYIWVTATSEGAKEHARAFYWEIASRAESLKESYVLEVASNDGTFLKPFIENDFKVLGVDPAKNIADRAVTDGVPTLCKFFGAEEARGIIEECGRAGVVVARNVLPHVANLHDFVEGLHICLDDNGLLVVEFHYASVIYQGLHYDSIYHEHLCYYTLGSLERLLNQHGLFVTDITESPISGGSLVLYMKKKAAKEGPIVGTYREVEKTSRVNELDNWQSFAEHVYSHREQLLDILAEITVAGGPIAGYGASARSSTLLNFCGIDSGLVSVIADHNPLKQGHYTAGTRIPIASPEEVMKENPEYVVILAWNFADEIMRILRNKFSFRGQCILPLPNSPKVVKMVE
ncbi:MAG: methyltransferase [Dehalococcoidales bacterium]|mgnify:CR=1 FL=1|nr:methyltransferase [Dehalococcoidales bacterium]